MTAPDRKFRVLACALAGQAGFVDALGFLHLKGYFVSFMSGNSTQVGVERLSSASTPLWLLAAFVTGVIVGSSTRRIATVHPTAAVLLLVAVLLLAAAACAATGNEPSAITAMALAMGAENAALERSGKGSIGVTYVTGALVKAGQGIVGAWFGGDRVAWLWDALLWAALVAGAIAGAAAYRRWSLDALSISTAIAVVLAVIARFGSFDGAEAPAATGSR